MKIFHKSFLSTYLKKLNRTKIVFPSLMLDPKHKIIIARNISRYAANNFNEHDNKTYAYNRSTCWDHFVDHQDKDKASEFLQKSSNYSLG